MPSGGRAALTMISFDFLAVLAEWPLLLKGLAWTLGLTLIATPLGLVIAISDAASGDSFTPMAGRPKKMKKSCTMKGVLRISSTYVPTTQRSHVGPLARAQAKAMPMNMPNTDEIAVRPSVQTTPVASNGHCESTAMKSSSTRI